MNLTYSRITEKRTLEALPTTELAGEWSRHDSCRWLDIDSADRAAAEKLLAGSGLSRPLVASCLDAGKSSRLAVFGETLFVNFPTHRDWGAPGANTVTIISMPECLITIHDVNVPGVTALVNDLKSDRVLADASIGGLLIAVLDTLCDEIFQVTIEARDQVENLARSMDEDPEEVNLDDILALKRQVSLLARTAEDQMYCMGRLRTIGWLESSEAARLGEALRESFTRLISRHATGMGAVSRVDARLKDMHQSYIVGLQSKTASRLRVLTIFSAVFLPTSLVTSLFAMTRFYMGTETWQSMFPAVLAFMILFSVLQLTYFWRTGWFR